MIKALSGTVAAYWSAMMRGPPPPLNTSSKWEGEARPALVVAKDLQKLILKLKGEFITEDGTGVDYGAMRSSDLFKQYCDATRELQCVDILEMVQAEDEVKCFFINIYNALTIHGLTQGSNLPTSPLMFMGGRFWTSTKYQVGEFVLSLDDIEHGILRGNSVHPSTKVKCFSEDDARCKLVVKEVDPRIHFALVCGAKSCPPIRVFTANNLEFGLSVRMPHRIYLLNLC
eukprot:scaffold412_cov388-Prasinococcus_capsulatus_cf.AAC.17